MSKAFFFKIYTSLIFIIIFSVKNCCNAQNVSVYQDSKFEKLLNDKRKINSSLSVDNRYKIQIFNGGDEESKKTLIDFKKAYPNYDVTIIFSTPQYKVWVGNYKSRIEAARNLEILKIDYPKSILIKPSN